TPTMKIRPLHIPLLAALTVLLCAAVLTTRAADKSASSQPSTQPAGGEPLKFYGTISAIDKDAKTFTVDNQTFNIVPESHMTKAADDSIATIADAVVGEPARGTYTKSADGKLNVTKVRFGKKTGGKAGGSGGKGGGK